jgi:hypothetical protein
MEAFASHQPEEIAQMENAQPFITAFICIDLSSNVILPNFVKTTS